MCPCMRAFVYLHVRVVVWWCILVFVLCGVVYLCTSVVLYLCIRVFVHLRVCGVVYWCNGAFVYFGVGVCVMV